MNFLVYVESVNDVKMKCFQNLMVAYTLKKIRNIQYIKRYRLDKLIQVMTQR